MREEYKVNRRNRDRKQEEEGRKMEKTQESVKEMDDYSNLHLLHPNPSWNLFSLHLVDP